tara:strand:- start:1630 stop:2337 length:708 start_codon:yes stop_codon:yes gene_type:complete
MLSVYYKIQKYLRIPIPVFLKKLLKNYYGKNNLDQQLEKYLNYSNGFFIELGAHDGVTQSNTYYYEKNKNWNGILIEPTKRIFLKCKKNRSKKNFFYNNACVSFKYKKKFVKLIYSSLKSFSPEFINDNKVKEYLKYPELYRGERNFIYNVKAATLNSLLDKSNAPSIIDFLSLDTEGAEFQVLNGIDFKKYKFKFMLIETDFFTKLKKFLIKKKYKFIKKLNENDYLFKYEGID